MRDDAHDLIERFTARGRKRVMRAGITPVHSTSIVITFADDLTATDADRTAVCSEQFTMTFSPNRTPTFVESSTTIPNRDVAESRAQQSLRKHCDGESDGSDQRMLNELQLFVTLLSALPKWARKRFASGYFADLAHHFWHAVDDSKSNQLTRSELDELVCTCVPVDSLYLRAPLVGALVEFHDQQRTEGSNSR